MKKKFLPLIVNIGLYYNYRNFKGQELFCQYCSLCCNKVNT